MRKSVIREYTESILIAAILALFIRTFVFQAFKIPTGSMEDHLFSRRPYSGKQVCIRSDCDAARGLAASAT